MSEAVTAKRRKGRCQDRIVRQKHGMVNTRTYRSWKGMRERCYDEAHPQYRRYGGRGITVCERWQHSFVNFLADMGVAPAGLTLDRKDNDLPYNRGNCRWATSREQALNRSDNIFVDFRGENDLLIIFCERGNLNYGVVFRRIERGWTVERALTTPCGPYVYSGDRRRTSR